MYRKSQNKKKSKQHTDGVNEGRKRRKRNKKHKQNVQTMGESPKFNKDIDYSMDGSVKQLFLNLTKMQIIFNKEDTLSSYFPNMETDEHGNFFLQIGDSKTMFCAHLDTYSHRYEPVHHIIDGDFIKTDGTTTLGGDDKAGVVIMIKMMEAQIPGLYYFFRGEEGVTSPSGTWGSKQALRTRKEFFSEYDKCIAFDRKGNSSIISQQMYSECCDSSFVDELISEFKSNGLTYEDDTTGMWCDSGVFMDLIPECTNISVGYVDEHTFRETQDIAHLEKLVNACLKIDWDGLPVKRDPTVTNYGGVDNYIYKDDWNEWDDQQYRSKQKYKDDANEYVTMDEEFEHVCKTLDLVSYEILNFESFDEGEEMYFQNMTTNDFFALKIIDFDIYISSDESLKQYELVGDLETFNGYVMSGLDETDLDDRMNHQIDSDNGNVDDSTPSSLSSTDGDYTNAQEIAFSKFILSHKGISSEIIDEIEKNNGAEVTSKLWMKIEKELSKDGVKIDYAIGGNNPDDMIDWIDLKIDMVKDIIGYNESFSGFKNSLIATGATEYYVNKQIEAFTTLIDKEHELVNLTLMDIDIHMSPKVRETTSNKITEAIEFHTNKEIKGGLKEINPQTFVLFVYDFTEDVIAYYKEK